MKRNLSITLEEGLVDKIDEERGMVPRSTYIESLIKESLENG